MASTPSQIKAKARSLATSPALVNPRVAPASITDALHEILELIEDVADCLQRLEGGQRP